MKLKIFCNIFIILILNCSSNANEIMGDKVNMTIPDNRNQTALEQGPPETIFPDPEEESIAYWLCPIILIILLWLTAMLYNMRKNEEAVEIAGGPETEQK